MKSIDRFLNNITMYRLTLYYLAFLVLIAAIFGFFKLLPYSFSAILFTAALLITCCFFVSLIFSRTFKAQVNFESTFISALILVLVVTPAKGLSDLPHLIWISVLVIASKYILAFKKKHLFNPVALGLVLTAAFINFSASWWIGTLIMLPFVLLGGLLIARKIQRQEMCLIFITLAVFTSLFLSLDNGTAILPTLRHIFFNSSLFFFAFVMLTEPLTTPPNRLSRIIYAIIVGFFFAPQLQIGNFYSTPEIALLIGNIFSFAFSQKSKPTLTLKKKIKIAPDIYDYVFDSDQKIKYHPGQYLEWTFFHSHPDSRGSRRYFTIASSPTENEIRVGIKFPKAMSSFKKSLLEIDQQNQIIVSQIAGDFVLPSNKSGKYVFIAGGIGITPFRSMIKYLLDKNEKRNIVLFYSNRTKDEFVYRDIFEKAHKKLGIKTHYLLTDTLSVPSDWQGEVGRMDENLLKQQVVDYLDRYYYLSGPHAMVLAYENILKSVGIPKRQIITDYFPGF